MIASNDLPIPMTEDDLYVVPYCQDLHNNLIKKDPSLFILTVDQDATGLAKQMWITRRVDNVKLHRLFFLSSVTSISNMVTTLKQKAAIHAIYLPNGEPLLDYLTRATREFLETSRPPPEAPEVNLFLRRLERLSKADILAMYTPDELSDLMKKFELTLFDIHWTQSESVREHRKMLAIIDAALQLAINVLLPDHESPFEPSPSTQTEGKFNAQGVMM